MLEPKLRSPAQDSVLAVLLHRMRVRQPVRGLVRLGHLLPPQALSAAARTAVHSGMAEQTAVPIVGPQAAVARKAALSGTAERTVVAVAELTVAETEVQKVA